MAGSTDNLTPRQERAISALLAHPTMEAAAGAAGVGERTLRRWLQLPEFAEAYRAARRQAVEQATARLQQAAGEAVETLRALLGPGAPPAVRLGAAKALLELAYRAVEVDDLERRIEALEGWERARSAERSAGLSLGAPGVLWAEPPAALAEAYRAAGSSSEEVRG